MPENKRLAVYNLTRGRTKTIGVIANSLAGPFLTPAFMGIREVAMQRGYDIFIAPSRQTVAGHLANMSLWLDKRVDGVLACLSTDIFYHRAGKFQRDGMVIMDNARSGYIATEHLIKEGCRRIAIVTSSLKRATDLHRYTGFRKALGDHQLPPGTGCVITADIEPEGGGALVEKILTMDPMPDGLFITDDTTAVICMQGLREAGIRVPDDIAIVGVNNDPVTRLVTPALTTVDCSGFEMGMTAATTLLDGLYGRKDRRRWKTTYVPPVLVVRHSSLKYR